MGEFWEDKPLEALTSSQWEALCDGCGKCCLLKMEDEDTGKIFATDVACKLLDTQSCQCQQYKIRKRYVPDCITLTAQNVRIFSWLPATCAYRLRAQGEALPSWHPLVSGDKNAVHKAGMSVKGRVVSEKNVKDLESHITVWIDKNGLCDTENM